MSVLKVVIPGAMGRMGRELIRYALDNEDCELYGVTERHDHPDIAKDIGTLLHGAPLELGLENDIRNVIVAANCIIDFTTPDSALFNLSVAAEKSIPMVIGTTGFSPEQLKQIGELAQRTRVVLSPNMSICVNLLWKIAGQMARVLGDEFDPEIVEIHHRNKQDAPSGTAIRLAQAVAEAFEKDAADITDHGRKGMVGVRDYGRIGMHAVRGGDIVGTHTLSFFGPGEELFVGHRATSRINFVKGAYRAARFLQTAEKGIYDMFDVLKL